MTAAGKSRTPGGVWNNGLGTEKEERGGRKGKSKDLLRDEQYIYSAQIKLIVKG